MASQDSGPIFSDLSSDEDMVELVQEFVACLGDRVTAIEQAAGTQNLPEITRLAHQLKGASGGYGFGVIGVAAAQLESASKAASSVDQLRGDIDGLIVLCRRASAMPPPQR